MSDWLMSTPFMQDQQRKWTEQFHGYTPESIEEHDFLCAYDPSKFPITVVTVDLVLFRVNDHFAYDVLLVKRGNWPYKGAWALPGGFIDPEETTAEAALRELQEEAGVKVPGPGVLLSVGVMDAPHRDPRGRAISHVFTAWHQPHYGEPFAGDDAAEARWFPTHAIPKPLAFDHEDVLWKAHKKSMWWVPRTREPSASVQASSSTRRRPL